MLLADDNRLLLSVLANALRLAGHDVLAADSGDKALRLLRQLRPDCAILDLYMPGVSGEEVARECRALDIPFFFLTAYDDRASRNVAQDLGARAYMVKPATTSELLATVDRCAGNPS